MHKKLTFSLYGDSALFADPGSKYSGEKTSYPVPTYETLKGICSAIYWKPTFIWVIDRVRIMNPIDHVVKGIRELSYNEGTTDVMHYTYLKDVHYQVEAHLIWNENRPEYEKDRIFEKHWPIAQRKLKQGGRRPIFLGASECSAHVEPCVFGEGKGAFDNLPAVNFGMMAHSFGWPGEIGGDELFVRNAEIIMENGVITFAEPSANAEIDKQNGLIRHTLKKGVKPAPILNKHKVSSDELEKLGLKL